MYNCGKILRFTRLISCSSLFNRAQSSLVQHSVLKLAKELPEGVFLEQLNSDRHDISKIRRLLVDAFFFNQEPIMHTLCERAYSDLPTDEKLPKIELQFEKFFSDHFLISKIRQGMSLVAIDKFGRYISSAFVEEYYGGIYETELRLLRDPFWRHGLRLMGELHAQARPFLSQHDHGKIAFMSHAATCPEYVTTGIMQSMMEVFLSRLAGQGFQAVYGIVTTKRYADFIEKRFDYLPVAEIMYEDYEIDGAKMFAHLADKYVSAKAMVKFL